jgi:hypothetical protein
MNLFTFVSTWGVYLGAAAAAVAILAAIAAVARFVLGRRERSLKQALHARVLRKLENESNQMYQ